MPPVTWNSIQKQLVGSGLLNKDSVFEIAEDGRLPDDLIVAVKRAELVTGHRLVSGNLSFQDLERLAPLTEFLALNFCGVPDRSGGLTPLTAGSPGGRWSRGNLSVSINPAGANLVNPPGAPATTPTAIIATAFGLWQTACPFFSFRFVPPGTGEDVRVVFGGTNVDPAFTGAGGVLASAGYPPRGNLQFDFNETWSPTRLLGVCLHEVGHLLGLSHSNNPNGLMYPFATPGVVVDAESREAINALYGWQAQQRLGDRGTSHRAMLATTSSVNFTSRLETLHMVWKGVEGDSGIYHSTFGGNWSPQERVPNVGCSFSPAITTVPVPGSQTLATGLLMAWKGVHDDQGIYWTRNLGFGWEPQRRITGVGTSAAPALANVAGQVRMAWKGVDGDGGIYWSSYDGNEGWSPQANVRGIGTTDSPALVGLNGVLHMFWKGIEGDANGYHSSFDFANDPIWRPQRRIEYFSYETGGGIALAIGTTNALSATQRGSKILLTWKGVEGDQQIWFSLFDGNEFSGQTAVAGVGTSVGPAVADMGGRSFMAWKGVDGDSNIYWSVL